MHEPDALIKLTTTASILVYGADSEMKLLSSCSQKIASPRCSSTSRPERYYCSCGVWSTEAPAPRGTEPHAYVASFKCLYSSTYDLSLIHI